MAYEISGVTRDNTGNLTGSVDLFLLKQDVVGTTLNPADKSSNIALSNGNLTAQATSSSSGRVRATTSKSSGKWTFCATVDVVDQSGSGTIGIGLGTADMVLATGGPALEDVLYYGNGALHYNSADTWVDPYNSGDVITVAIDLDNWKIWVRVNNGDWNSEPTDDPSTNTGGLDISGVPGKALFPDFYGATTNNQMTFNFGTNANAPDGFTFIGGSKQFTQVDHTTSDASTGAFIFTGIADNDPSYNIVAYKDGSPNAFDVSDRNLQPTQSGGTWTPASAGALFWFAADQQVYTDAGTTLATNGQTVQQWNDLSGNLDIDQPTAGSRPQFVTNVQNSLPAVYFDDTRPDALWSANLLTTTQPFLLMFVIKPDPTTINNAYSHFFVASGSFAVTTHDESQSGNNIQFYAGTNWGDTGCNSPNVGTPGYYFYLGANGASSKAGISGFSETSVSPTPGTYNPNDGIGLGVGTWRGYICEVFCLPGEWVTSGNLTNALAYVQAKWGV